MRPQLTFVTVTNIRGCLRHLILAAAAFILCTSSGAVRALVCPDNKPEQAVPWYVTTPAIHRVMLKPTTQYWRFEHLPLRPGEAKAKLQELLADGITAIEIFAPEEGGNSYDGLDAKDRYRLDPEVGSMDDFRNLVKLAHLLGMHVITFQNLGYSSTDADNFLKAADDERAGRTSRETAFYYWSDRSDAPAPAASNSYFFVRPSISGYDPTKSEFWQWSDRAQKYYWTRWPGRDAQGNPIHLPQYNWAADEWPDEARKVVRFWLDTGIDGMVLDAVNWYAGIDWQKNAEYLTTPLQGRFSQPEGGGAFHTDDPVGWVTDGGYTNLFDYGLGIWWEKGNDPLAEAIRDENPQLLEQALRRYHDRVVAAGGTLYFPVPDMKDPELQTLAEALLAASGDMLCYCAPADGVTRPAPGMPALLKLKAAHPALFQNSERRMIHTSDDHAYAILRRSADRSERLLLVFNFSSSPLNVRVDTGAIYAARYVDVVSHTASQPGPVGLTVQLAARGYRIFQVS